MTDNPLTYLLCFLTLNVAAGVGWLGREWMAVERAKEELKSLDRKRY